MDFKVIKSFLPELVTAVSGCVQSVSDQCMAKGLIATSVYNKILESGETSKDKARILIQAVSNSTDTDERCFELFMNILEQELPYAVRDGLLEKMRREANEKAGSCTAVVPSTGDLRQIPRGELPRESVVQQKHLLGRLEEAVRQHQRACDEKKLTEEKLKAKTEECHKLKRALDVKMQSLSVSDKAKDKISTCESEIKSLKKRVEELESIVEEQAMQVKRGRNNAVMKTKEIFIKIAQESHTAGWEEGKEETRDGERELTIQGKDTKRKKLEDEAKQHEESSATSELVPTDALTQTHFDNLQGFFETMYLSRRGNQDPEYILKCYKNLVLHLGLSEKECQFNAYHQVTKNLSSIVSVWSQCYPGDSRGTTRFPTYSGLRKAFLDSGFGDVLLELPKDIQDLSEKRPY